MTSLRRPTGGAAVLLLLLASITLLSCKKETDRYRLEKPIPGAPTGEKRIRWAAIIDHLSDSYPNEAFLEEARGTLEGAGIKSRYYPHEAVTVDLYRSLPGLSGSDREAPDLLLLRVHSAVSKVSGLLVFFTSEPFDFIKARTIHMPGFFARPPRLETARLQDRSDLFIAVTPSFFRNLERGFDETVIIIMGCNGLDPSHQEMARALIEKGALVCIGWDDLVATHQTDRATLLLLEKMLVEKMDVRGAVTAANEKLGPDPTYGGRISWYPEERGSLKIRAD